MAGVPPEQGVVAGDGVRLHYRVEGKGLPVLVIGSALYYPRTFSSRLRESLRLVFIDVRHFAETDDSHCADDVSLDTYLEDIDRVRARLGIERAIIMGHSHHGNLALEYARRYPARASHLVLIGSPPVEVNLIMESARAYWEENASESRKAVLQRQLHALDAEALAAMPANEAFVTRYVAEGPKYWYDPEYDASHLWQGMPVNMDVISVFRDFFANGYRVDRNPARYSAPILVIMGRHDYAVPHTLWDDARPILHDFSYRLFDRSGHTPQLEEPDHFDRTLLEWLDQTR